MKRLKQVVCCLVTIFVALSAAITHADVFNMSGGQTSLQFVTVGDPGNAADTTGYGAVGYTYQMGKYDVTSAQYCAFLNAVATTADPYGLSTPSMASTGWGHGCGIVQTSGATGYSYTVLPGWANMPVNNVTFGDAARFCNWLQDGQPVGAEGPTTTETGAYTLNGGTSESALMGLTRNAGATYFIPSQNEWYKAAYYKGGSTNAGYWLYPTQSNTAPSNLLSSTGTDNANFALINQDTSTSTDPTNFLTSVGAFAASPGPFGTYDMGGNVYQWNEAILGSEYRGLAGGCWGYDSSNLASSDAAGGFYPTYIDPGYGFRVASVPEPSTLALLVCGMLGLVAYAWRRRQHEQRPSESEGNRGGRLDLEM